MTRRQQYDVHVICDTSVLTDVLTYAEDHGRVLSVTAIDTEHKPNGAHRYTGSRTLRTGITRFKLPGVTTDDHVLDYFAQVENTNHTRKEVGAYIAQKGYVASSANSAVSRLIQKKLVARDRLGQITITDKGRKEHKKWLANTPSPVSDQS